MKDTYFDQNRLMDETDRRFHATDLERVGGYVQVVPAVVERLAPLVTVGAWSFSERVLQDAEAIAEALGNHDEIRNLRRQRWWVRRWRRANGLYRVRVLDAAERALATRLLGEDGMPAECFPRAEGWLKDDNDARIIAQVIAVGGTLLLSSNLVMVRDQALQDWFDAHHNEWPGVQAHRLVRRIDPLFCEWWKEKGGTDVLTRTVLAAFWPVDAGAPPAVVRKCSENGLQAMARGHFKKFAPQVLRHLQRSADIPEQIERVRRELPRRTREAEAERRTILASEGEIQHGATKREAAEHNLGRYDG